MQLLVLRHSLKRISCLLIAACISVALAGCGSGIAPGTSIQVASLASEDVPASCTYTLTLEPIGETQQGVIVLFERGDTANLYNDPSLRAMALSLHYAILWAHECTAPSSGDLQADAARGPGRMLFAALTKFSQVTDHPELDTAKVFLYGFSAAGVLTATIANEYPDRLLGMIQYAPGSAYTDLDSVPVKAAIQIPALILGNADDASAGTSRGYRYFQRGRALSAPWAWGVQNATTHCCNLSTRNLILPWMQAIAAGRATYPSLKPASAEPGSLAYFSCTPDGTFDASGEEDCKITAPSVGVNVKGAATAQQESGWLPDQASSAAWLTWVTSAGTN